MVQYLRIATFFNFQFCSFNLVFIALLNLSLGKILIINLLSVDILARRQFVDGWVIVPCCNFTYDFFSIYLLRLKTFGEG